MIYKYILFSLLGLCSAVCAAQTLTFEKKDYKQLGVYDTWEASPFRSKLLKGNYAVVKNHLKQVEADLGVAPNASNKILAVQRSRFGSNTFGVRIDLKEPFELTPKTRYLHVMVHRPYSGRVMVVGLGKRIDRAGQSPSTEQFWALSAGNVGADKWHDVVFPIKGNGGIEIYSLVVVPDCESPHHYTEDKACYIDNIEVNDEPRPKFVYGFYALNFDKNQRYVQSDRCLEAISLTSVSAGEQRIDLPSTPRVMYNDMTTQAFCARAGETVTAAFAYKGGWMHGYVYLDRENDGRFNVAKKSDHTPEGGSDVMTYSYYGTNESGHNSAGIALTGAARNVLNPPAFTLPADMPPGYYRLRYVVDWNSMDPAGSVGGENSIVRHRGAIADVRLNIHGDYCNVNDANRNGAVLSAQGEDLVKYQAPFGKPFTIKMVPSEGFEYAGILVKYGYNLSGDSIVHDNLQWQTQRFDRELFDENHLFTIPAEYMVGDVEIEGLFIEEGTYAAPSK